MGTPFEIKQKATQGDLLGRNQRALRRSWEAHQACIETRKLIEKHLPGLVASPPQTDDCEAGLKSLLSAMEEKFPQFHRYRAARLFLSRGIENGNATGLWHLDLPPVLIRISRQEPLRTEGWFRKAPAVAAVAAVAAVMARFRDALGSLEADPLAARPDLILGAILLSAMTNGGLCDPDDVMALVPALGKAQPAAADGDTIWIDVTHRSRGHLRNDVDGEDAVTRKRWFVDPTSLGWLIGWMALAPDRQDQGRVTHQDHHRDHHPDPPCQPGTATAIAYALTLVPLSALLPM